MGDKIIGIDLGTTYSCVAIMEAGKPIVVVNPEGSRSTPSVVSFPRSSPPIVGTIAKRQAVTNAQRTVQSIKREMGTNFRFMLDGAEYSPEQISALILQKLRADAESYLGESVNKAVITIPAYFDDAQRQATREAGQLAGLEIVRMINEPTASALAYGFDKATSNKKLVVFDLGGGTLDASILHVDGGQFEVKATSGTRLGGDDFDQVLVNWMKAEFQRAHGLDVSADLMAVQRLREAAEKAKLELSSAVLTQIHVPFLTADASGPKHLELPLSRSKFNELTADLVSRCMEPVERVLKDAGLTSADIDNILLVGGCTRIPAIQDAVKLFFAKEPDTSINPDEAVALGAAVQGSVLSGESGGIMLLDVTPLSLGVESAGGIFTKIIEKNTTIPTSRSMYFTTTEDEQSRVEIHVLQGERELAKYNKPLAKLYLDGLPKRPRGALKIEIAFEIDADGIMHVTGRDVESGIKQTLTIERSTAPSPEEAERLEREARDSAAKDQLEKDIINARMKGHMLLLEAEQSITRYLRVVPANYINGVKVAISRTKTALTNPTADAAEIMNAVGALDRALMDLGRAIYSGGNVE